MSLSPALAALSMRFARRRRRFVARVDAAAFSRSFFSRRVTSFTTPRRRSCVPSRRVMTMTCRRSRSASRNSAYSRPLMFGHHTSASSKNASKNAEYDSVRWPLESRSQSLSAVRLASSSSKLGMTSLHTRTRNFTYCSFSTSIRLFFLKLFQNMLMDLMTRLSFFRAARACSASAVSMSSSPWR